jgi:hypothetical protein
MKIVKLERFNQILKDTKFMGFTYYWHVTFLYYAWITRFLEMRKHIHE